MIVVKTAKKYLSLVLILSMALMLAGALSIAAAERYVDKYFGWIGRETLLSPDAIDGSEISIDFDSYADPGYWHSPYGVRLILGLDGLKNCLDLAGVTTKQSDGFSVKLDPNSYEAVISAKLPNSGVNSATGYFGRITLTFEITDIELLKQKLEAADGSLSIGVEYAWHHQGYYDASYLPAGYQNLGAVVHIKNLTEPNHTKFVSAAIVTNLKVKSIAPTGGSVMVTLNRPLDGEILIVAAYDSDGSLLGIDISPVQQAVPFENVYAASFGAGILDDVGTRIKAMVWEDWLTAVSLCPAGEVHRTGAGANDWTILN